MNKTDSSTPTLSRIALLGGGEKATELLQTVRRICPTGEHLRVVAVCDTDDASPALAAAREEGVPHVGRLAADVFGHDDVDVLVDLRQVAHPGAGVEDMVPADVQILGVRGIALLLNMLDLTRESERSHANDRAELRDTHAQLDQLMALAPFSIYMKDTQLNYLAMNRTALDLLGLESADVLGKSDFDLFPNAVARRIQAREQEVLEDLKPTSFQGVLPLPDGEHMYFSATIFPVVREGRPLAIFGLLEDITELHDSERKLLDQRFELRAKREELKGIFENSHDIIFLTDPSGRLKSYNNSAENVFGPEPEEALDRPVHAYAVDSDGFVLMQEGALADGHSSSYEIRMYRHDGGEIVVNASLTRVNDPRGRPVEVVGICRDITERLMLREDLIQTERLAAIGKMAAGVAHEINNPLVIIETVAGVMEDTLAEVKPDLDDVILHSLQDNIDKLYAQTRRCTSITHNLLGFARRGGDAKRRISVPELLDQSLDLLRSEANRLVLHVMRYYGPDLPQVYTDPQLLEQVFVNLLENAMDAIEEHQPPQAMIELTISLLEDDEAGQRVAATISDNGVGISEENINQVFDLFYTSKPAGKGTGLGLSIVHNILEKIGAEIRVESRPEHGSTFTVIIPVEPPAENPESA